MKNIRLSYLFVILYTFLLFLSVPYVRPIQKVVYNNFGKSLFTYLVLGVIFSGLAGIVFNLWQKGRDKIPIKNLLWLISVSGVYIYLTIKLWKYPEEAIHFLEYGFLGYLLFKALSHHIKDITIYFVGSFIIFIIGTVDEIIQWIIPNRYWDFRDVGLNFLAGALFQVGIWKGFQPSAIAERINTRSVKVLSIVLACSVIILGICIAVMPLKHPSSL